MSADDVAAALAVDDDAWKRELPGIREYFAEFGDRLPRELIEQLDALEARLGSTRRYARTARVDRSRGFAMSVTAYVLIQTEVGRAEKVAKAARDIAGVVNADNVAGPYDVIVQRRVRAPSTSSGKLVVSEIQKVDGITRTFTCPIVNL